MRPDKVHVKEEEGNRSCHYSLLLKIQELTLVTLKEKQEMKKISILYSLCINGFY